MNLRDLWEIIYILQERQIKRDNFWVAQNCKCNDCQSDNTVIELFDRKDGVYIHLCSGCFVMNYYDYKLNVCLDTLVDDLTGKYYKSDNKNINEFLKKFGS